MTVDLVRARWLAGDPAFAAWLLLESPVAAEVLGSAGFDAAVVDLQHGSATLDRLADLVRAIEATPAAPFLRTAANDPAELMRALDLGVRGLICPMVGSRRKPSHPCARAAIRPGAPEATGRSADPAARSSSTDARTKTPSCSR